MAGIIYELVDVLEQEDECYEGLDTLASYTETAVLNKNIEFLGEVTKTEEAFIGRLNILSKKRDELMKDIAIVTGVKQDNLTISNIIEKIGKDTEMGIKLSELRKSIKIKLDSIKKKSEFNKQLLMDSLELVDFTVNAARSSRGYTVANNYNKPGEEETMQRGHSIFDQRQ